MASRRDRPEQGGMPSREDILAFIRDNPERAGKREIARAFGLKGVERRELAALLETLADDGLAERSARKFRPRGVLPPVGVLEIFGRDSD
ncbi:MAG: ribonuclease R, partial [Rhizobiaceae bacterium]